jgi:catechol 2,3-dioxygenase-like lactoylglutathione lyase family enzyme
MLQHVALEVHSLESSEAFFTEVLGLVKTKSSVLSPELNRAIFGKDESIELVTYANEHLSVELFVTGRPTAPAYRHLCLAVPDKQLFAAKCEQHNCKVITAKKGEKELMFVKDFSGNLYEIK